MKQRKWKKSAALGAALAVAFSVFPCAGINAYADGGITVKVNGADVVFDQPPIIENDRTLVPMRAIFEALGATVAWEDSTQTASATMEGTTVLIQINNNIMLKNGAQITLDVPAKELNDRTLVPVRAIANAFGSIVGWNESTQTVTVLSGGAMSGTVITDEYRVANYDGTYQNIPVFDNLPPNYAGMELLHISDESGADYARIVNKIADRVGASGTRVFNAAFPTASEFYAPKAYYTDYTLAFTKIYNALDGNVTPVNTVKPLMEHAGEKIYFNTDHHWTQRGAYYAYHEFIRAAGDTIAPLSTFETSHVEGYLGSLLGFTQGTEGYDMLVQNPDLLERFLPAVEYEGKIYSDQAMQDHTADVKAVDLGINSYLTFLDGDQPLEVFKTSVKNGKKLAIVKDSYGNAFATWALNNFEELYIIDPRKFNGFGGNTGTFDLAAFCADNKIQTLLIASYPVSIAAADQRNALEALVQ